jgi:ceramide glucosyltransferase
VLHAHINWLLLLEDIAGFCFWVAGFFGNTILWRGRRYTLESDGRFRLVRSITVAARNRTEPRQ